MFARKTDQKAGQKGESKVLKRRVFSKDHVIIMNPKYCTTSIRATLYNYANEILIGRTNQGNALYEVVGYEGALLH